MWLSVAAFAAVVALGLGGPTLMARWPQVQAWLAQPAPTFYRNCAAAHARGVYSIRRGEPGYRRQLDADGDGIACEPYRPD